MSCAECLRPINVILKFFNEQMGNYIFIWQETLYSISFLSKKCLEQQWQSVVTRRQGRSCLQAEGRCPAVACLGEIPDTQVWHADAGCLRALLLHTEAQKRQEKIWGKAGPWHRVDSGLLQWQRSLKSPSSDLKTPSLNGCLQTLPVKCTASLKVTFVQILSVSFYAFHLQIGLMTCFLGY